MKIKILLCCALTLAACSQEQNGQVNNPTPTTEPQMVWPQLEVAEPSPAVIGEKLKIVGRGGYLEHETEAGIGYDESSRTFQLYYDDEVIGELGCFVNRCEGEIIIPIELEPGEYEITVEGGSSINLHIVDS